MPSIVTARKPEDLAAVNDVIHDCWFDKDDVRMDLETATLTIRFIRPSPERGKSVGGRGLLKEREIPHLESFLRVHHVRDWILEDTEGVGFYDFNEVRFDPQEHRIEITTGVPLKIAILVEQLDLEAEVTEVVTKVTSRRSLFRGASRSTVAGA